MKQLGSTVAVAFALANLYLLFLTGPLVSPQHQLVFHLPGSATVLFVAVIIDLLVLTLLIGAALHCARHHPRLELLVWAALWLPVPLVLVQTIAGFAGRPANVWVLWCCVFFIAAGLSLTLMRMRPSLPLFQRVRPALTTILAFVSVSGLVLLIQLLWCGWEARDLNAPLAPHAAVADSPDPGKPRVIWIILDELSFRQVYGSRFPGLQLPNFDRLASDATVFTNAQAAAEYTRIAVPSLLTGESLTATAPAANGRQVLMRPRGSKKWQAFDPQDSVFGDVVRAGLPTGVAGWYEPYCRLLPNVLNRCFWTYNDNIPGGLAGDASVATNALQPLRTIALDGLHLAGIGPGTPSEGVLDVQRHAADYRKLLAAGDDLLLHQDAGLTFLHMPIPHPWGFYDRRTASFPGHRTSYLDNLALADAYVGHVIALLQGAGAWDHTTLIIMGDHGWRAHEVWSRSGFWTKEEQQASHAAALCDQPAVIVKLAGQTSPARVDARYDSVRTRALVDGILNGQIRTPEQLGAWVKQGTRPPAGSLQH